MINSENMEAALRCLDLKISFVLYSLPGEEETCFFANPSRGVVETESDRSFMIVPWLGRYARRFQIADEMSAVQLLSADLSPQTLSDEVRPWQDPTLQTDYIRRLSKLIDRLKLRGGKTVFSRVICGHSDRFDIRLFVEKQFASFPMTFRYLYFTPETGAWLGTSPEIFLDLSLPEGDFQIMSLAGTRLVADAAPWDNKNIAEQGLVADYISKILRDRSIEFKLNRCCYVVFEPVCHICDIFSGRMAVSGYPDLLDSLNPTPALGGYPLDDALNDISELETHPRRCYGGYVGLKIPGKFLAYVNLRNVNFDERSWCIYAGGGITAASNPGAEWNETENKTEILCRNLKEALK